MGGESEQPFGLRVISRAWFGAWGVFDNWRKDIPFAVITVGLGEWTYYRSHGIPDDAAGATDNIIHAAAPAVIIWLLVFLWHLWLAPAALAYEAVKASQRPTKVLNPVPTKPSVNWAIWRQHDRYDLMQLASILAKEEPKDISSNEASAFLGLLQEDTMASRLPTIKSSEATEYHRADAWPKYFSVKKADAMKWAKDKAFDLSHIS